ncbi:hypothetical protein BKM31_15955 [[Actinomadura] parvosata subsp. kistnae]|uniref:Uncharacterized protein n=1 Tax=[Actinomadura] parvosata subsp. kistnae TaxID=1909395 RepID=A0A1U9ZXS4_9ACTN|nr:hypothetical protein [Nonomuraea sp. ATCC 55076]AQZ62753.1 hypothetical protein BKM31_15955 [Nonomuraea sp. ATCC 55076]
MVERVNDHVEMRVDERVLTASLDGWAQFLRAVQDGKPTDGSVRLRTDVAHAATLWNVEADGDPLNLNAEEWATVREHIERGDFDLEKLPRQAQEPDTVA